jgi:hypothetical protein
MQSFILEVNPTVFAVVIDLFHFAVPGPMPYALIRLPAASLGSGTCCTADLTTARQTASRV